MNEIKKIMVAIGFSTYSRDTLEYAAKIATELDAKLLIANIINVRDVEAVSKIESLGYKVDSSDYIKGVKDERKTQLDDMLEEIHFPKEKPEFLFKVGNPIDKLMSLIESEEIDLVIIGPKDRTDLKHVLLGSIAEKLTRHSTVPVLIFKKK